MLTQSKFLNKIPINPKPQILNSAPNPMPSPLRTPKPLSPRAFERQGPSIVIAYATCVDWGHRAGDKAMVQQQVLRRAFALSNQPQCHF